MFAKCFLWRVVGDFYMGQGQKERKGFNRFGDAVVAENGEYKVVG